MNESAQLQLVSLNEHAIKETPFSICMQHLVNDPSSITANAIRSLLSLAIMPQQEGISTETQNLATVTAARLFSNGDRNLEQYFRDALGTSTCVPETPNKILTWYVHTFYTEHPLAVALQKELTAPSN